MKAILLLGGEGTRLRPLTNDTPKPMLPICGRPMIEWVCEHLARHGVDGLVLSLGYRADAFAGAYPSGRIGELAFGVAVEPEPLGTAGAVRFAAERAGLVGSTGGSFLVLNGDVLTDLDIGALVGFHRERGPEATIALQPVADPSAFGLVEADSAGWVKSFAEKPEPTASGAQGTRATINAGTYVLEPAVLERIAPDCAVSIEREVFPALATDGALAAMTSDAYWLDTGTPAQYLAANLDVLCGKRPLARVADGLGGAEHAHRDARVRSAVLGGGCVIGADAVVQRSVLGDGCRVGEGAVVADSILGERVEVGAGAVVRDFSVVGPHQRVPQGARLRGERVPDS